MPEEVLRAMAEANDYFVDMHELNKAAGDRIAEVTGAEAGLVTAGSFSAMVLASAACLSGTDPEKVDALPHPTWPKRECLLQKGHRLVYDRAFRAGGATIVEAETKDELITKISEKTAFLGVLASVERQRRPPPGVLMPEELVEIGKKHGVPVVVDAASELPPVDTLTRYVEMGADLVIISGGKGIRGPQSNGILAGRKDLIEAATLNHSPYASIGRGMKVGKEEIIGFTVALNRYVELDHEAVFETWNKKARWIADQLQGVPGLTAFYLKNAYGFGEVRFEWDRQVIPLTPNQVRDKLKAGEPRIVYYDDDKGGTIQGRTMRDGEEIFAVRRLREFFLEEGKRA
jgi:L-seryl-tRNA(Ser) seleniumtransferase